MGWITLKAAEMTTKTPSKSGDYVAVEKNRVLGDNS